MKKIAYILPGYGESDLKQKGYNKIAEIFESHGIRVVHVDIPWEKRKPEVFADYTSAFLKQYKKPKKTKTYILGFSFGASIAFLTSLKTKPTALILCSLSPYFKEDLIDFKPSWLKMWRKNFVDSDYSFVEIASKIKSKTYLIVGSKENKFMWRRSKEGKRVIKNSSLITAKNADHKISQRAYLKAIEKIVRTVNKDS